MSNLEAQAVGLVSKLRSIPGIKPIQPQGAMYVMVQVLVEKFTDIANDQEFSQKLLDEEMVFVLPGSCFKQPNFVRLVFCAPTKMLDEACQRINNFALSAQHPALSTQHSALDTRGSAIST
jgi:tyrosine aminotransferase